MIGGFNIFGYGYGYSDYQNGNTPSLDPLSEIHNRISMTL